MPLLSAGSESVKCPHRVQPGELTPQDMRTEVQSMIDNNAVLVMGTSTCPFCIEVRLADGRADDASACTFCSPPWV